jgi:hypothetical protein
MPAEDHLLESCLSQDSTSFSPLCSDSAALPYEVTPPSAEELLLEITV